MHLSTRWCTQKVHCEASWACSSSSVCITVRGALGVFNNLFVAFYPSQFTLGVFSNLFVAFSPSQFTLGVSSNLFVAFSPSQFTLGVFSNLFVAFSPSQFTHAGMQVVLPVCEFKHSAYGLCVWRGEILFGNFPVCLVSMFFVLPLSVWVRFSLEETMRMSGMILFRLVSCVVEFARHVQAFILAGVFLLVGFLF